MKRSLRYAAITLAFFGLTLRLPGGLFAQDPFETISQGAVSYYRYDDENFLGADMLVKDDQAWAAFWEAHTAGIFPPPPLPDVDFDQDMVIVTILGLQPSAGPTIEVKQVGFERGCGCLRVQTENNTRQGGPDVITNPFHIVKLGRSPVPSILFEHGKPPRS